MSPLCSRCAQATLVVPGEGRSLAETPATRSDGLSDRNCNHPFRATGINAYPENGGTVEHERQHDRSSYRITPDELARKFIL